MGGGISYDILLSKPEFGAHIATVSHIWAMIEMDLADLLDFMAGQDSGAALSLYLSMVSLDLRLSALSTVAQRALPKPMQDELDKLLPTIRKAHKERNRVAHARWAENGVFPDGIILLPHAGDVFAGKKSVYLYKVADFLEIEKRLVTTAEETRKFSYEVYLLAAEKERQTLARIRSGPPG
jgi:hypothetical protein